MRGGGGWEAALNCSAPRKSIPRASDLSSMSDVKCLLNNVQLVFNSYYNNILYIIYYYIYICGARRIYIFPPKLLGVIKT